MKSLVYTDRGPTPACSVLTKTLSIGARIPWSSTSDVDALTSFLEIGKGLQGVIFQGLERDLALKKEHPHSAQLPTNLKHEYEIHAAVSAAFDRYAISIGSACRIPIPRNLIEKEDSFWDAHAGSFSGNCNTPSTLVMMERIRPLHETTRNALISYFLPGLHREAPDKICDYDNNNSIMQILHDLPNKHCLVRTYLGRRTGTYNHEGFSLRNFPLHLQSMLDLNLDVHGLAAAMGKAFAVMHWGAGVNGDDVEFVLGTDVQNDRDPLNPNSESCVVDYYRLDFGQCDMQDLEAADSDSVYQSFKGAMVTGDNQLFIPNCLKDAKLFSSFKTAYIGSAESILLQRHLHNRYSGRQLMAEYEEYAEDFL